MQKGQRARDAGPDRIRHRANEGVDLVVTGDRDEAFLLAVEVGRAHAPRLGGIADTDIIGLALVREIRVVDAIGAGDGEAAGPNAGADLKDLLVIRRDQVPYGAVLVTGRNAHVHAVEALAEVRAHADDVVHQIEVLVRGRVLGIATIAAAL